MVNNNNNNNNNQTGGKRRRRRKRGGAAFTAGPSQAQLNTHNEITNTRAEIAEMESNNAGSNVNIESVSTVTNSPVQEKKKGMFSGITGAFEGLGNKMKKAVGMTGGKRRRRRKTRRKRKSHKKRKSRRRRR